MMFVKRSMGNPYQVFIFLALLTGFVTFTTADTREVPNVTLKTSTQALQLSALHGQVVYVDFWASWCVPCRKSFPWMNEMHSRYAKQGLKIVAINVDEKSELAQQFLAENPAQFTIAYDPNGSAAEAFKVRGMPNSYLIDRQGRIHSSHVGFLEKNRPSMEAEIKSLLTQ